MNRKVLCRIVALLAAALLFPLAAMPSAVQWRYVVVNGQQLHPLQVAQLERLYCSPIANGRYWYNSTTGVWGYEGDPRPQGVFVSQCFTNSTFGQRRSLSQRGLLYSTNEILRGRP